MAERVRGAGVEVLAPAAALGFFDGIVPVWSGSTLHQIRARAPHRRHRLDRAAADVRGQRPPGRDAVLGRRAPGLPVRGRRRERSAVVATTADRGLESALALDEAGVEIAAVADARPTGPSEELGAAARARQGSTLLRGTAVVRAFGRGRASGARSWPTSTRPAAGSRIASAASTATWSPSRAAPCRRPRCCSRRGPRRAGTMPPSAYLPEAPPAGIRAAGAVAGHGSRSAAEVSGSGRGRRGGARARAREAPRTGPGSRPTARL